MQAIFGTSEFRRRLTEARQKLYRTAFVWTRNRALAEDLVQETSSKALNKAKQLRDIKAMDAWLFRIMINCWRDHLRQNPITENIDDIDLQEKSTPEIDNHRKQLVRIVRAGVEELPETFRQTLTLVDLEGFSYIETAEILEVPVGTVMSRLSRARSRLRDLITNNQARYVDPGRNVRGIK